MYPLFPFFCWCEKKEKNRKLILLCNIAASGSHAAHSLWRGSAASCAPVLAILPNGVILLKLVRPENESQNVYSL